MSRNKLPSKYEIAMYWNKTQEIFIDFGEPDCWACGCHNQKYSDIFEYFEVNDIPNTDQNNDKHFKGLWNGARLERHHIVPVSLNGSSEPSNLFLLCAACHEESPHTDDRGFFLKWASYRKSVLINRYIVEVTLVSEYLELSLDIVRGVSNLLALRYSESKGLSFHRNANAISYFRDHLLVASRELVINQGWDLQRLEDEALKEIDDN